MGKTIKNVGAVVNRQHFSKEFKLEGQFGVRSCIATPQPHISKRR